MILVDTSVWVDHIDRAGTVLSDLLVRGAVLCHPFVIGEIIMGNLRARAPVLKHLLQLPSAAMAHDGEVREFIEFHRLYDAASVTSMRICSHPSGCRLEANSGRAIAGSTRSRSKWVWR